MKTLLIIPAYQDTPKLLHVLMKCTDIPIDRICLVIDEPTESDLQQIAATAETITPPVEVLINKLRQGIGYAIKRGIRYALTHGYDIIVVMAGNNKDDPQEISRFLHPLIVEGYDYIQGSRYLPGGQPVKTPILRGIFSRLYPFIWTLFTKVHCTDVTNGFRGYKTDLFTNPHINIWQSWLNGYELEYYIHYKALTLGLRVKEVPVSKTYPYRHKGGYSKIDPFQNWWEIVGPLFYLKVGIRH